MYVSRCSYSNVLTFHDVYSHQAHGGRDHHVADCVHCDRSTNSMANQDDGGRSLTVAGLNHISYITEGGQTGQQQVETVLVNGVAVFVASSVLTSSDNNHRSTVQAAQ